MEFLKSDERRVWTPRKNAGTSVSLGWLAPVPNTDQNDWFLCSLLETGGSLLLKERGGKAQTGHSYFFVIDGESL